MYRVVMSPIVTRKTQRRRKRNTVTDTNTITTRLASHSSNQQQQRSTLYFTLLFLSLMYTKRGALAFVARQQQQQQHQQRILSHTTHCFSTAKHYKRLYQRSAFPRSFACCNFATLKNAKSDTDTTSSNDNDNKKFDDKNNNDSNSQQQLDKEKPVKKVGKSKKFKVNENLTADHAKRLAEAFDELARKEGFDSSMAHFAEDATFEDDFTQDYSNKRINSKGKDIDDSVNFTEDVDDDDDGEFLDDDDDDELNENEDDLQFFDEDNSSVDMAARLSAARRDMQKGKVTVPQSLDEYAQEITPEHMKQLGFRAEVNPFGNDETPRRLAFLPSEADAMSCSACGADFQAKNETKPGYLPPEKYERQQKLAQIQELQKLQQKADSNEWSPEDEIEYLLQTANKKSAPDGTTIDAEQIDVASKAAELGIDLEEINSGKLVICKRCHGLQNFGKVDVDLRPGYTDEPLLSQEHFRNMLRPLKDKKAVIIALVDLFDFAGSVLPELDSIAGDNPVILAANKADLLPDKMGNLRVESWVRRELEYLGVKSLANIGGSVRLVSCKTGTGVEAMLDKAKKLAEEIDGDIYVVGAANAGKSTLLNNIIGYQSSRTDDKRKHRAGNANARKGVVTTSPLPGTTLKFIKINLGGGRKLYDTPGLLVPGTLTHFLTPEELKIVVPKKKVEPITFRLESGKCVLVGGLARVELVGDSKPFLFTFFVANEIKLHPTDGARASEFVKKHAGGLLTPPLPPGPERMQQIGAFEDHIVDIDGNGWREAAADITLTGLGWVAVTGAGTAKVKVSVPQGIGVAVRPPLMPFDVWEVAAKYTGGRAVRKSGKTASGKRRKGVGRQ